MSESTELNVCCTPEILAKEMDHLHQTLLKKQYPDWIIKEPKKKPPTPIINQETGIEIKKNILIYGLMFLASVKKLD